MSYFMSDCVAGHKKDNYMNELMDSMVNDMEEDTVNLVSAIKLAPPSCWIKYNDAEVKQLLLYTAIEMESIRASAQSQRQAHETLIEHLEELLESARRERDETIEQCVNLTNQLAAHYSNAESVARTNNIYKFDITHHQSMISCTNSLNTGDHFKAQENLEFLPEKGKFVEAVVRAGPLLQTLLVGCPLPHWRYPPPPSSAIHCSQPQLIGPQTTDSTSLRPPGLRYNDFSCCCIYNSNAGGFFPPFFSNFRPQFSPPWETDRSRQVLQGPLQFIHAGESGFSFKGNALGNVVFNYGSEECPEGETMMSTWTMPEMGSTQVGFQPASNFGSEKMCFTPPTMVWNRTI